MGAMGEGDEGIRSGPAQRDPEATVRARPDATAPLDRHAAESGLASLLMGLTFMVVAGVALLVWGSVIEVHERRWDRTSLQEICALLITTEFVILLLVVIGVLFGLRGLLVARAQRTPAALPLAGILVGLADVLFWLIVLACSFGMTFGMLR